MIDTLLSPSQVIGSGYDIPILTICLKFALGNKTEKLFRHSKPILGMDRSIRLLGQSSFDGSAPFRHPLGPEELATELVKYSNACRPEDRARYQQVPGFSARRGWTISRSVDVVDEQGYPLIAAYATWIEP